jgi:hypothetical protein
MTKVWGTNKGTVHLEELKETDTCHYIVFVLKFYPTYVYYPFLPQNNVFKNNMRGMGKHFKRYCPFG